MRTLSNLHAGLFIFTSLIPLAVQVGIKVLSPETPEGVTTNLRERLKSGRSTPSGVISPFVVTPSGVISPFVVTPEGVISRLEN